MKRTGRLGHSGACAAAANGSKLLAMTARRVIFMAGPFPYSGLPSG
jgi:hypothetical protein